VFCGVLDFSTGELWFSNAGHNPPLLVRGEREAEWLKLPPGFVLGPDPGSKYITQKIVLAPNDALITYTDGVTEAMNPQRQLFSERRLLETVRSGLAASPAETVKLITEAVAAHAGSEPQSDDITVLVLKYR
jgi:sigma-B regulation protein RsbU (phosphoserine phosphatase)